MEELLNKLIEKGWRPFGNHKWKYWYDNLEINNTKKKMYMSFFTWTSWRYVESHWLREICSKESWLWQFCCENGMVVRKRQWTNRLWWEPEKCFDYKDYEYRLIETSLKNEDELEQFLLDNIIINEQA